MRVLLVSGGSIGHVAPLIAVWRAIQAEQPGATATVLCADRPEELQFCRKEGLNAVGLPKLRFGMSLPRAFLRSVRIARLMIDECHPDVVFCKGGSVSVPACWLAHRRTIPIVLHESDAVMGRANRLLRPSITKGSRDDGLRITGFRGDKPVLLVCGGSQGAQAINEAIVSQLSLLRTICDVVHLTGPGKPGAARQQGYFSLPFAHEELPHFYAMATVAVSRAGAGTMSELAANGIPAILIPIRGLAQDHQWLNARAAVTAGYADMLEQEHLDELATTVSHVLDDAPGRAAMSAAGKRTSAEAARRIAKIVCDCVAH
jgi:UDP-N-acetylglucosamine--N-acetylmuramyl-(pentapeptide) pyrophosphoryl-undecaprenol N-acetylglucosamine transferase